MPRDVQDIAVRNRAVSVYSPTRPIRRPGQFANAGTAQNVLGAVQQQPQSQPVSPRTTFGAGAAPQTSRLPGWTQALGTGMPAMPAAGVGGTTLDRISARMPQVPEQEEPGGFWGSSVGQAIGTVVNNPVGRGIMTALDTLQYPRRIVQSSINEVADAFNAGDVSFDDWTQQIGDEDFGFGHMTPDTGITLLDGLIGFTGDVLLDPLTFVGGAGLWSGIAGKSARAGAAATIEAAGVKVGQLTVRETAEQVGRWGFSRFDDAARAELRAQLPNNVAGRILDRGYHFKVPLTQRFIPIPGTSLLDRGVSRGAGRVRDIMTHSPLGDWMRYASTPGGQRDAITTLVTKRPRGGFDFGSAAEFVNFKNGEKLASKSFVTKANQIANVFLREAGGSGPGWQKRGNGTLSDMFRTAETVGGTRAHDFYAAVRKMAQDDFGIRIPEFEGAYLPHMWTERGLGWLNGGTDAANKFKALLYKEVDINDVASVSRQRKLLAGNTYRFGGEKVGDNWVGGHTFTLVDGSADEINKIFRRLVPDADFDLLDTDFASTAHRYIKSLEPQVGVVGGLKKVLGSKSGLVRDPLNGSSLTDLLRAEDLDALASAGTAQVLKTKLRTAVSTVRQVRDDNIRGVSSIGGDLGVQARAALDELATVPHATKRELDDAFTELQRLEELRGVGKYNDRFNVADATTITTAEARRVGTIHAQFEKVWNGLAKKHRALEKKVAKLKAEATAEARRIEARGGKGATPVMDEYRRVAAEAGETAIDEQVVGEILRRLELNRAAQATIDARLGDRDFINLAVADDLSPKSPGSPAPAPATSGPPAYTGPSPLDVSTDFGAKRANVLGDDPRSAEIATRFEAQAKRVDRSRRRMWETRVNNTPLIDSTHDAMVNGRRYEAGLKHAVEHSRGKPELLEQHLDYSRRLDDFREGELPRLQAEYNDAKRPLDDAENTFKVDDKKLQEIRDEQMALARTLDARRGDTPRLPLTPAQHAELTRQRTRLRRDRGKWLRSPEGKTHVKAQQQLDTLTRNLEDTSSRIERLTSTGGRFYIDADGAVQTKFTTQERWALDLIDHRTNTLIPARNAADARHDAARETWERLSVEGADVTTAELHAARREVDDAYKAWRTAQEAVVDANKKLTGVTDVPDLGRIGADADKLRRLLANQASMKGRLDDLARQTSDSGQQLYRFDDGIAGIDTQLQAQATAARIAAEAPPTPYGAQIAHLNRQEIERLDAIEAKFAGYRSTWDDPGELPANPSNLGRFEGQWEDNPTIKRAMDVVNRGDRVRTFQAMDTATDLANSQAAVRTAAEPFTVPPKGTPAHTAVMEFSPASRGGAMGAVGRGQAVAAETQRFLDNHVDELVEAGALSREYGDEMFRRRLDLDRALDLHAQNPSAHIKAELEQQASELGRFTEFALRYKAALEGGNEPSNALGAFLLARQLDDEAVSLRRQIDVGNRRLSTSAGGRLELDYSSKLAGLNVQHAQLTHNIEAELAKARSGATWNQQAVDGWTRELDGVQQRIDRLGPPSNGMLDDAVDSHAAYLADDMRSLDDAQAIYSENRFVDHRMQWPVRRKDELMAAIPHRQGEVQAAKMSQRRLEDAVGRARAAPEPAVMPGMVRLYRGDPVKPSMSPEAARAARAARGMDWIDQSPEMLARNQAQGRWFTRDRNLAGTYPTNRDPDELNKIRYVDIPQAEYDRLHGLAGAPPEVRALSASPEAEVLLPDRYLGQVRDVPGQTVRYTPYNTEGFKGSVAEMPLVQAEQNLVHNQQVIAMLEADLVNKQVQISVLEGTAQERLALLERELADVDTPFNPPDLALENNQIRQAAETEQRALSPGELETIASNQARIDRLNRGVPLDGGTVADMQDEAGRLRKAIDDFEQVMGGDAAHAAAARDNGAFIDDLVRSGRVLSSRDQAMLRDIVGPETAAAAQTWIHFLDEAFAGKAVASGDEFVTVIDDMTRTFGDNELVDRLRERAIASLADDTVSFDEMRDELSAALLASANRQRGEAIRETTSMQALFGTSFVDGPTGLRPRFAAAAADDPSHQLLTARLRAETLQAMRAKGYDPRNAMVDEVADLRTRLGRVETMRRGIEGNEEWMDVLATGTPSAQARRQVRETLEAGGEALRAEEGQLVGAVDAGRQARMAEELKVLDNRVAEKMEPLQTEMNRLQQAADQAERTHNARLRELDMSIATARERVMQASRSYEEFEQFRGQLERTIANNPSKDTESLRGLIDDMRWVDAARRGGPSDPFDSAAITQTEALLTAATEETLKIDAAKVDAATYSAAFREAQRNGKPIAEAVEGILKDGWRIMAKGQILDNPEGVLIANQLADAIENVVPWVQKSAFWQFIDRYTAFFKTYATAKPGFHVRNALSATFMNMVDGVRLRDMWQGARLWRQFERDPNFWMKAGVDPKIRDAFHAAFASGAGGAYGEFSLEVAQTAQTGVTRALESTYRKVMNNALTRWNRRLGSRVEGSARLAMALNTTLVRGGSVEDALRRVTKFHFDYSEISDFDRYARRLVPFWTFMSRNLPLQLEQMFINPRAYQQYNSLVRNFGQTLDPYTPDYWISQGAFTVDEHAADREAPWYIAPDLPHLRVTEPLDAAVRGDWGQIASNINPLFVAPAEAFVMKQDLYTGAPLEGYEETTDKNPFLHLFNLLGGTETAGSGDEVVKKSYAHIARSLIPPWDFVERVADPTGRRTGRTDETLWRALGAPVYQLNDPLRETTRNRAYYEQRDRYQTQAELASM